MEIVGEHGIELIHAYSSFPEALVASIAGDELHLPVVLRMGGRSWYLRHQRIGKSRRSNYHDQLRYVFDTVDCLAFNSPALKEHTSELFQELKIRPTPNQPVLDIGVRVPTGVDRASDPFAELVTADRLVLACIGKFKRDSKRQDLLVRAIKLLGDEFPLTIIFAGDGPNRDKVEMLARTEGVGEHAVFLGNITHGSVFRLLQGSDMVLHPSEFEGSSKAIAEAMLYGKPVIASDSPSIREHIQDGVTGILAENSAASFADKIRELVLRPALRERIGNNARAYATHQFDPRRNVVMYEELFLTLVNRSKRRPPKSPFVLPRVIETVDLALRHTPDSVLRHKPIDNWRIIERLGLGKRQHADGKLAYYWKDASSGFWDEHWESRQNERQYVLAETGYLGDYERLFTSYTCRTAAVFWRQDAE